MITSVCYNVLYIVFIFGLLLHKCVCHLCNKELLTYLLTYLFTYLLAYLHTYLFVVLFEDMDK